MSLIECIALVLVAVLVVFTVGDACGWWKGRGRKERR